MQVTTVGLDLAKNIFHVHGVTEDAEVAFNRPLRRSQVLAFFDRLAPCLIGVEACASSHYWARELSKLGHSVRLMPPMYVKPYVKRGKSDAVDAEAICEAVTRPTMRFVEIKSEEQQALLSLHRARDFVVRQRTQLINMLRSLAAEFGVTIARGVARAIDFAKGIIEDSHADLPELAQDVLRVLSRQLIDLHNRLAQLAWVVPDHNAHSGAPQQASSTLADHSRCWASHGLGRCRDNRIGSPVPKRPGVCRLARSHAAQPFQ